MSNRTYGRNAFETTLDGGITAGASTIDLTSAAGLTAPGYLVLEPQDVGLREYIKYTGISTNQLTGVSRGLTGSVAGAQAHDTGKPVRMVWVQQYLEDIFTDIEALEARDHGDLGGLNDDDHPNLLNAARHHPQHPYIVGERVTSAQDIAADTDTTVIFNSVDKEYDSVGAVSLATGTGIFTVGAGLWMASALVELDDNYAVRLGYAITSSLGMIAEDSDIKPIWTGNPDSYSLSGLLYVPTSATIWFTFNNDGGPLYSGAIDLGSKMTLARLSGGV